MFDMGFSGRSLIGTLSKAGKNYAKSGKNAGVSASIHEKVVFCQLQLPICPASMASLEEKHHLKPKSAKTLQVDMTTDFFAKTTSKKCYTP